MNRLGTLLDKVRLLPVEAVPAALFAFLALVVDEPLLRGVLGFLGLAGDEPGLRWIFIVLGALSALALLRTLAGIWLFAVALAVALLVVAERWKDGGNWRLTLVGLAVASLLGAAIWTWVPAIRRLAVEAVPAVVFGLVWLFVDEPQRWLAAIPGSIFAAMLFRTDAGIRLFWAAAASALFAWAVFWEDGGGWRLALIGAAVVVTLVARWLGAVVWPDVAIILIVGLGVVAVRDARAPEPEPEPPRPAIASFELPAARVRPPAHELRAASQIELVALTPARSSRAGAIVHEASRFDALLLTPVQRSGADEPVRVLVERGEDGEQMKSLARASLDATEFVLVPKEDCFVAPRRDDLPSWRAEALLHAYGFSEAEAEKQLGFFSGAVDLLPVLPGRSFRRYYSQSETGRFLTDARFFTQRAARAGLSLPSEKSTTTSQSVVVVTPTMVLRGHIKGAAEGITHFFVLRTGCFRYRPGEKLPSR